MAFKNEYVPPLEQETSEFLKKAREILRMGFSKYDAWTVDRERDMVLVHLGFSRDYDGRENWSFLDRKGKYFLGTSLLAKSEISPEDIAITRTFHYVIGGGDIAPDAETIACIKEALREYKDWGVISDYKRCQLTLIDSRNGKEI